MHLQRAAGGGQVAQAFVQGPGHERLKRVELQLPGFDGHGDGGIVANGFKAGNAHHFRNHRIDLAGHDGRARLAGRQLDIPHAGLRAGRQQAQIVADLGELDGDALQNARNIGKHPGIGGGCNHVLGFDDGHAGKLGQLGGDHIGVAHGGVDAGANGGAAHVDFAQQAGRFAQAFFVGGNHRGEGGKFLAQGHGHGILQLGAANFQNVFKFFRFHLESPAQRGQGGQQILNAKVSGQLHRRGVGVVGRLRSVHVVIGVNHVISAFGLADDFQRPVGNHFVGIHIGRSACAALQHVHDEMRIQHAGGHVIAGLGDGLGLLGIDGAQAQVGRSRRFFHIGERADQVGHLRHAVAGDGEVLHRTGRVHAPVGGIRQVFGTEEVAFLAHGVFLTVKK